jgi:hypothetical protein
MTSGREMDIKTALGRLLREPGIKDGQEVGTTGSATRPTAASSSPLAIDADSSSNSGNSSSAEGSTRALTTHPDNWKPKPEEIVWIGRPLWHDLGFMIVRPI